jgi:uncharacterized protein YbjQ (UPF0145 family)
MKLFRFIGSLGFVLGLFTVVFIGVPWHVMTSDDPVVPLWLQIAIFALLGGILLVMISVALEQPFKKKPVKLPEVKTGETGIIVSNSEEIPGKKIEKIIGLVQGHTVFAIWLGNDLSAMVRLILGGELTEYTQMMGKARTLATQRMLDQAIGQGADAVINLRYMTTSVVGNASEILVYGTAVKLSV